MSNQNLNIFESTKPILYLVASKDTFGANRSEEEFLGIVREALAGENSVDILQLREKNLDAKDFYALACRVKSICDECGKMLIINDRIDIALACKASGVHIGVKKDLPVRVAREILGEDKILGLSLNQASEIESLGEDIFCADYLGVGAVWDTTTKADAITIGVDGLANIIKKIATIKKSASKSATKSTPKTSIKSASKSTSKNAKKLPIIAIGGIYEHNVCELAGLELAGVAVVRAIMDAKNPKLASQNLKEKILATFGK